MSLPTRQVLLGITLGAVCATAINAIGPGYVLETVADEMPAGFDTSKLVKFDDRYYEVDYDASVSTDPISTATVKKIEAGRVSYVQIASTATGTYSTDAMTSPHVQYPGIAVEPVAKKNFFFSSWSRGKWTSFGSYDGHSFTRISRWR